MRCKVGSVAEVAECGCPGDRVYPAQCRWDAAEPGKGYAEKAAEWRAKLEEMSKSKNVETSKRRNMPPF